MFHSWPDKMDDPTGSRRGMDHVRDPSTIWVFLRQASPGPSSNLFALNVPQRSRGQVEIPELGHPGCQICGSSRCLALFVTSSTLNQFKSNTVYSSPSPQPPPTHFPPSPLNNDAVLLHPPRKSWTRRRRRRLRTTFSLYQIRFWPRDSSLSKR